MASTIFSSPCTVPATKGLDCKAYLSLKPTTNNLRFSKTSAKVFSKRALIVRASESEDGHTKKLGMTDAECEAAVVAGNVPEAPPVPPKPAAPAGTPVVPSLVSFICVYTDFSL